MSKALAADDVVEKIKIRKLKRTFPHAGRFEERSRKAGLHFGTMWSLMVMLQ
jgi:hypothetical protein